MSPLEFEIIDQQLQSLKGQVTALERVMYLLIGKDIQSGKDDDTVISFPPKELKDENILTDEEDALVKQQFLLRKTHGQSHPGDPKEAVEAKPS